MIWVSVQKPYEDYFTQRRNVYSVCTYNDNEVKLSEIISNNRVSKHT